MSLGNSIASRGVERRFGAAIAATRVENCLVFILGHYRSGTTHLHELMSLDPRYASPNRFQTFNPATFLGTERWLGPVVEPFMLPRRVQEDEVAPMVLTQLSPYMDWCFPRSRTGYARTLTFRRRRTPPRSPPPPPHTHTHTHTHPHPPPPPPPPLRSDAFVWFLKALTLKYGRPLILKSPPHAAPGPAAARETSSFPDARFVHIRRDPYKVFISTVGLLKAVRPVFGFQLAPGAVDTDAVLDTYRTMYDAYFADRELVPPGQLIEIAYEDLDRDPLGQLRAIYGGNSSGRFRGRPARGTRNPLPGIDRQLPEDSSQAARRRNATEGRGGLVTALRGVEGYDAVKKRTNRSRQERPRSERGGARRRRVAGGHGDVALGTP